MSLITDVYAAVPTDFTDPLGGKFDSLADIFGFVVNVIIGVGWALVFVMLALGFIQYTTSQGESKATDKARMWLTYAVVGGVGLFFVSALKAIIPTILGTTGNVFNVTGITDF